jgi:hypothetical protein
LVPYYLGSFHNNYIIFRKVVIFTQKIQIKKFVKENTKSFKSILLVETKISKIAVSQCAAD